MKGAGGGKLGAAAAAMTGYLGEANMRNKRGGWSSSSSSKGKKPKPKPPQRGLGVDQLEKILHGPYPGDFNHEDMREQKAYPSFSYSSTSWASHGFHPSMMQQSCQKIFALSISSSSSSELALDSNFPKETKPSLTTSYCHPLMGHCEYDQSFIYADSLLTSTTRIHSQQRASGEATHRSPAVRIVNQIVLCHSRTSGAASRLMKVVAV
ncbi:hypothetical protein V6N12_007210 [Hibiscus sabdariffa]|uniref:Uncharacterized protein n=1 Tax=Hibiscus sabdariffa TaxID=183260 RepID=A0ABR2F141_9ROSI